MKLSTLFKWLPVAAAALGAAGYSQESRWLQNGVAIVKQAGSLGADGLKDVLPDLSDLAKSDSSSNTAKRSSKTSKSKSSYSGRVTKISDGDTLRVTDSDGQVHKIRMAYIDAPETKQAYGTKARDTLADMAESERVKVIVFETDRYGREVAQVFKGNTDLNYEQIRQGSAWHYTAYAKNQNRSDFADYAAAEKQARQERLGLWKGKNPQEPWQYRKEQRAEQNGSASQSGSKWFGLW